MEGDHRIRDGEFDPREGDAYETEIGAALWAGRFGKPRNPVATCTATTADVCGDTFRAPLPVHHARDEQEARDNGSDKGSDQETADVLHYKEHPYLSTSSFRASPAM